MDLAYEELVITPEQDRRMVQAIAVLKAKRAAIRAGLSPTELNANPWLVNVDPL